jgi:hypothetical protein
MQEDRLAKTYHFVVLYRDQWHVMRSGERYGPFRDCAAATEAALTSARKRARSKVLVQGADDRFHTEWSSDPEDATSGSSAASV